MVDYDWEYQALKDIESLQLANVIVRGFDNEIKDGKFEITNPFKRMLQSKYNESQLESIISATKVQGITLIKGPPGTGKSFTILGILSTLLGMKPKPKTKKYKSYSIKQLLEADSSDDEDYNNQSTED